MLILLQKKKFLGIPDLFLFFKETEILNIIEINMVN